MSKAQASIARWMVIATVAATGLIGCGSGGDSPPANTNTSTCYRCSVQNSAIIQSTYACTPAYAQQFGRPCVR